jgi:crossover junction endodeoxyribonuclease RusA
VEFRVIGEPAPQGSKAFKGFRRGKAVLVESSVKVKPWREAIGWAVFEAHPGGVTVPGPVAIDVTFTLPRPKGTPKRIVFPKKKPDLDKLVRSTFDGLTDAHVIEDDSCVVQLSAAKVFPNTGGDSLLQPGAVIRIQPL